MTTETKGCGGACACRTQYVEEKREVATKTIEQEKQSDTTPLCPCGKDESSCCKNTKSA
jgi:hypothetical protein